MANVLKTEKKIAVVSMLAEGSSIRAIERITGVARLQVTISHLHKCGALWRATVPVHEVFQGKTLWQGDVEVFDLTGHPKAKRCYGWSYGEPEEFITILELPPVDSPESAVKVGVAYQVKKARI
jgi:hypothetical protein